MFKVLLTVLSIIVISSLSFAELKLKLPADLTGETTQSLVYKNVESNLNLNIAPEVVPPSDMKEFVKGMIILGLLADVSFPMGGDEDFGHFAGTGFSGHAMLGYVVANSWLLTLRGGYVAFGEQTTTGTNGIYDYTWTESYSQIPILLGAYYLFNTNNAFKPYIGLALGLIIQNYTFEGTYNDVAFPQFTFTESADKSSTGFGIVPALGCYYLLGSVMLNLAVEYNMLFGGFELTADDFETNQLALTKINGTAGIAQDEGDYSEEYTVSYLSVLLGVSFPVGK